MHPYLRSRLVRVANEIQITRHFRELVDDMAKFANRWSASSAQMKKGLESRDVDMLSNAIIENRKDAQRMEYVLQRYERIVSKISGEG